MIHNQEKNLSVKADTEMIKMKNSYYKYILYIQENRGKHEHNGERYRRYRKTQMELVEMRVNI